MTHYPLGFFLAVLSNFLFFFSFQLLFTPLPIYVERIGGEPAQVGLVMGALALAAIFSRPGVGGWLTSSSASPSSFLAWPSSPSPPCCISPPAPCRSGHELDGKPRLRPRLRRRRLGRRPLQPVGFLLALHGVGYAGYHVLQEAFIVFRSHYLFESHFCTPGQGKVWC